MQWTCWNTLLTMQLMLTHVGCAWTDREGRPVQHLLFCSELVLGSSGHILSCLGAEGLARLPASLPPLKWGTPFDCVALSEPAGSLARPSAPGYDSTADMGDPNDCLALPLTWETPLDCVALIKLAGSLASTQT